jgi:hypothetical protein
VISKGVEVLSNYGWLAVILWAVSGSVLVGLALIGFWGLGFAGTAMPSGLYWVSWLSVLLFLTYLFLTVRVGAAFIRQRIRKDV